ncbi:MAG: hypothetical protein HY721_09445 [Planctomycetes bacterium]|nr:hypothetical protein [Planctomycetota bacterium]
MRSAYGTYHKGRVELDSPVDWPEGARVAISPAEPGIGLRESDWPDSVATRCALAARLDSLEPLELTAADEAEIAAAGQGGVVSPDESSDKPPRGGGSPVLGLVALVAWLGALGALALACRAAHSFEQMFKDLGQKLPGPTVLLMDTASLARSPVGVSLLAAAVAVPLLLHVLRPRGIVLPPLLLALAVVAFLGFAFSLVALFLPLLEIIKSIR